MLIKFPLMTLIWWVFWAINGRSLTKLLTNNVKMLKVLVAFAMICAVDCVIYNGTCPDKKDFKIHQNFSCPEVLGGDYKFKVWNHFSHQHMKILYSGKKVLMIWNLLKKLAKLSIRYFLLLAFLRINQSTKNHSIVVK